MQDTIEKYKANPFIDFNFDILIVKDNNHKFVASNTIFSKLSGVSQKKLIGLSDYDLPWAHECEKYRKHEKDIIAGLDYPVIESLNGTSNVHLFTRKTRIYDAFGHISGTIANASIHNKHIQYSNLGGASESLVVGGYGDYKLTKTEAKVLYYFIKGYKRQKISIKLQFSQHTYDFHIRNIKNKFKVDTTQELLILCYQLGFENIYPLKHNKHF
ncbi:LuxR C-terminal-related transcriptional regulator [Psychromonas sp. SP041]|uniref:LuxR C-terminal-related transcriptional regulator n=1 Tax=Psychromonas sp. SP041 TaxID=1365007 RepID=UPI0010C7A2D5|nr:LuxR C-terminal-related transcriptional regulator [Psychromonas sp. SP041]